MKKYLSIFLSAVMIFSLASCGGQPASFAGGAGNKPAEPETTLNWYLYLDSIQPDQDKVFDRLNEYLKQKLNVIVSPHFMQAGEYGTKMPVIISSGQDYDICFTSTWGAPNYLQTASTGAFLGLKDDLLKKDMPETLQAIPEKVWNSGAIKGTIYGVPIYKEIGTQYGLMINADLAEKYHIDYKNVKSWKDMGDVLSELHQQAPDVIGLNPVYLWTVASYSIATSPSVGAINIPGHEAFAGVKENTVIDPYETPEFKDYCDTVHQWFQSGYFPQNPQTYSDDTRNADDKANRLFSWVIGYAPDYEKTYSETVGHHEDYIPLTPVRFEGASNFQCVSAKSKNPDLALKFLNLVNTDKTVGNLLRHGIEGVHYKKAGTQVEQINQSYGYDMGWQFGSVFNQDWIKTYPADIAQSYEKWNSQAVDNPLVGYTFDDSNFKNQIAAISNVTKQYSDPLVLGTVDWHSTLSTFIDALKKNGLEDLLKEEQKQVDNFLKTKSSQGG